MIKMIIKILALPAVAYALYVAAQHRILDTITEAFSRWPQP